MLHRRLYDLTDPVVDLFVVFAFLLVVFISIIILAFAFYTLDWTT